MSAATPTSSNLVIASRESALALWQARNIQARLQKLYPQSKVTIRGMTTQGDRILDRALDKIGGKGLFVKELEDALAAGTADIAVHSMKDVPMDLPAGFAIAAITERADPRDAFVSNEYADFAALPAGSVVGTSSLRRESQIRARFPQLVVEPLRGNVQTRLKKLDDRQYAAIVLAAAGLKRLGLADRITAILTPEQSLPAPGQGALGIECRADRADLFDLMRALHDPATARAGGQLPVAARRVWRARRRAYTAARFCCQQGWQRVRARGADRRRAGPRSARHRARRAAARAGRDGNSRSTRCVMRRAGGALPARI